MPRDSSWIGHPPIELAEPRYLDLYKKPEEEVVPPPEVLLWMEEAVVAMVEGLRALHAPGFLGVEDAFMLDLSQAPYTVPCPTCHAFALEPCRHERRRDARETPFGLVPGPWPITSRMVKGAHRGRWDHWEAHPEYRVVALHGDDKK